MPVDYVLPEGNEAEFLDIAKQLGYTELVFVYSEKKLPAALPLSDKLKVKIGILVDSPPKKKIPGAIYICKPLGDARGSFEKPFADIVYGIEFCTEKDSLFQRKSGFNHIFADLAAKKNVTLGFFTASFSDAKVPKHVILGRVAQNLHLCRKFKVKTVFGTLARNPYQMRNYSDIEAYFRELGK